MMKKSLLLIIVFLISFNLTEAQIYPYFEDFNNMTTFTNPVGWTCTVPGFQVYPNHGTTTSNGMTVQMTTLGLSADSAISPFLGPVTTQSEFSFDYRIMETNLYPNFAHTLTLGETVDFYAMSGPFSQLLATIDFTSHITSTSFAHLVLPLGALSGNSGNLIIKVTRTNGDFFADFDNFSLADATGIAENITVEKAMVYPNPAGNGTVLKLKGIEPGIYNSKLIASTGSVSFEKDIVIDSKEDKSVWSSRLSAGIFILELNNNRNNYHINFVVMD